MLSFPAWKKALIALICVLGLAYAAPNFLPRDWFAAMPDWAPGKQINLGLDLRGGSHLLLEVDVDAVLEERIEAIADSIRLELRNARVRVSDLSVRDEAVTFRIDDAARSDEVARLIRRADPLVEVDTLEPGAFEVRLSEDGRQELLVNVLNQSIEIVRRRVDELGTQEPLIQRQGDRRIVVQVPGFDDPQRLRAVIGQTAKMTFHLLADPNPVEDPSAVRVPPTVEVLPSAEQAGLYYLVEKRVRVSGENLVDSQPSFDQNGQPVVSFRFDSLGGRQFGQTTTQNAGRVLAIVLDGQVISAPRINEPIIGGSGIITGRFTLEEVNNLAVLLRAGALPAPLTILEERTVGPGLGQDSIEAGQLASILGLILVVAFMIVSYGRFGAMAVVALTINIALIVAVLSGLQATLTLPGIAGIVLTIGMAVDANVLIFERIREEQGLGRGPVSAVDAGYRRAFMTIVDANLTTLFAAIILFAFGSGPIRGFSVTLMIGIVTSMFTAIMVTRFLVVTWLRRTRPQTVPI